MSEENGNHETLIPAHFKKWVFAGFLSAVLLLSGGALNIASAEPRTFYVATSDNGGNDSSGDGSSAKPWLTVAHAASQVTTAGDIIHVGTSYPLAFDETAVINLAVGVSLEGEGETNTIIKAASAGGDLVDAISDLKADDTIIDGNQTISYITFDGNNHSAKQAVVVWRRNNVTIHHVTMKDCYLRALAVIGDTLKNVMADNIQIYNSTFMNSGLTYVDQGFSYGTIWMENVQNSVIRHSTFDESNYRGYNIKGLGGDRVRIHNNVLKQAPWSLLNDKGFSIEFLDSNNSDVFDNWTNGSFSIRGSNARIHHNTIVMPDVEGKRQGVEITGDNASIFSNYIEGTNPAGIASWAGGYSNLRIYHNVISNCSNGILLSPYSPPAESTFDRTYIYNNTIDLSKNLYNQGGAVGARIQDSTAYVKNLQIRNNIISNSNSGSTSDPISAVSLTGPNGDPDANVVNITDTLITHNIFYNNTGGDIRDLGATRTTFDSNTNSNPLFKGGATPSPYYVLQASSPAIGTGVDVGLPYLESTPDKGAFVQDRSLGAPIKIEAEMNYSVASDVGPNTIGVADHDLDSYKSVHIFDPGDAIRVHYYAPADGAYILKVRVRSGDNSGQTNYFTSNGYEFKLDSATPITLTGNPAVSGYDTSGGGIYWGTMEGSVTLSKGAHSVEIRTSTNSMWNMVDYVELVPIYELTVSKTGTGTVTSAPTAEPYNANTSVTLTATQDATSVFGSWSGCDSTSGNTCTVTMIASKTVTAIFNVAPDLVVTQVAFTTTAVRRGRTLSVTNSVTNQGTATAGSSMVGFRLSTDTVYGNTNDVVVSTTRSVTSLPAGAKSPDVTTRLTIPSTTPLGIFRVCAMSDSGSSVTEGNEDNNTLCSVNTVNVTN